MRLGAIVLTLLLSVPALATSFEDALTPQEKAILVAAAVSDPAFSAAYTRDRALASTETLVRDWRARIVERAREALGAPSPEPGLDLRKQDLQGFERHYFLGRLADVEPGAPGPVSAAFAGLETDGIDAIIRRKDPSHAKSLRGAMRSLIKADLRAYLAAPGRPIARETLVEWLVTAVRPGVDVALAARTAKRILAEKPSVKTLAERVKDLKTRSGAAADAIRRGFAGEDQEAEVGARLDEIAGLISSIEKSQNAAVANLVRCLADARSAGYLDRTAAEGASRDARELLVQRSFNLYGMRAPAVYNEGFADWEGRVAAGFPYRVVTTAAEHTRRISPLTDRIGRAMERVKKEAGAAYPSFSKGCAAL